MKILSFWDKFAKKGCFPSKTEKVNTTTEFCILKFLVSVGTEFKLKLTSLMFRTKFAKKGYFPSKIKIANSTIQFYILDEVWS